MIPTAGAILLRFTRLTRELSLLTCLSMLCTDALAQPVGQSREGVTLMTLNVAHARADGTSQLLQSQLRARDNLNRIAEVVRREQPDIIAFQEIDHDSFWNGSFNHSEYIARLADYPHVFAGTHQSGYYLDYGTALISRHTMIESHSISFRRPLIRPGKGFVMSAVEWPEQDSPSVDLVSIHLDFLLPGKRRREIDRLISTIESRDSPRIVMGDFNTDYRDPNLIPYLVDRLSLHTWEPHRAVVTFPLLNRRLDWVLVSDQFEFIDHRVLSDPLSDHQAVIAEVTLR